MKYRPAASLDTVRLMTLPDKGRDHLIFSGVSILASFTVGR